MIAIFDCDGVLLDSNGLKTQAFHDTVKPGYGVDAADALVAFHRSNGGISRRLKFEHLFSNILSAPPDAGAVEALVAGFGRRVRDGLLQAPLIQGVDRALRSARERGWTLYVVSGGDRDEILATLTSRGLADLFAGIHGGERRKRETVQSLLAESKGPAVFFGDSAEDHRAASQNGIPFVFVSGVSEWANANDELPEDVVRIRDFTDPTYWRWFDGRPG
jgi:phosphoglycolate phosphatase-like HAD superfamily hydrolase